MIGSRIGDLFKTSIGIGCQLVVSLLFAVQTSSHAGDNENEITFGFSSGFGIKANFQNPSIPVLYPTSKEASTVPGKGRYAYNVEKDDGSFYTAYVQRQETDTGSWVVTDPVTGINEPYTGTLDYYFEDIHIHPEPRYSVDFKDRLLSIPETSFNKGRPGFVPGIHLGYRRVLRSDDEISLGFLAGLEFHIIDIKSQGQVAGQSQPAKDTFLFHHPTNASKLSIVDGETYSSEDFLDNGYVISNRPYGEPDYGALASTPVYRTNNFEANMFVLRLGMDFRYKIEENMSLHVGLGVLYAPIFYDYSFRDFDQEAINSPEYQFISGDKSDSEGIFGSFFQVRWEFGIRDNIWGYVGIRHMHMDKVKFEYEEDRWVELNFRNSIFFDTGITFLW